MDIGTLMVGILIGAVYFGGFLITGIAVIIEGRHAPQKPTCDICQLISLIFWPVTLVRLMYR